MAIGTLVTFVQARPLLVGDTEAAVGTVLDERAGFLGIRNFVRVEYSVHGDDFTADIPVKGNGFPSKGNLRVDPYYYRPGDHVDLLVRPGDPSAVRTAQRWTPAVYNWSAVLAFGCAMVLIFWAIFGWDKRRAAKAESTSHS